MTGGRDGVADLRLSHVFHSGDEVTDLADAEPLGRLRLRRDNADLEQFVRRSGRHHGDLLARDDLAVHHADVGDHAAVGVVDGVEDHGSRRRIGVALRSRHQLDHLVEEFRDARTRLARHAQHVVGLAADDVRDLLGIAVGVGGGKVDLVQHRDDGQVLVHRQVQVCQRLRLDPLRGVDKQNGTLTRFERTRHLVGEVDVTRGVDEVQHVVGLRPVRAVGLPGQAHVLRLDRDATLTLDVHAVEVLGAHVPLRDHARELQHPIGQRRFAVVDVRDDAEVPDPAGIGERGVGESGNRTAPTGAHQYSSAMRVWSSYPVSHGLPSAGRGRVAREASEQPSWLDPNG